MNITTKFDVGQVVWFRPMGFRYHTQEKISGIRILSGTLKAINCGPQIIVYELRDGKRSDALESELFATEAEAREAGEKA